jgi:hypothetical protein
MIVKDKSVYLNYVKDIENKVKSLCSNVSFATMQDKLKQDIEKTRVQIMSKVFLIKNLANQETGLIPNSDWVQYQKEIDSLYQNLSSMVKKATTYSKPHEIVR